jgi:hypothetical protein
LRSGTFVIQKSQYTMRQQTKELSAIEITSFLLQAEFSIQDFIEVNVPIDAWLKEQPGFISRHIAQETDGRISDVLLWGSVKQGTQAMHRLMDVFRDSPIHSMIDQGTVSWNVMPVRHQI